VADPLPKPGDRLTYYPRRGKPGSEVEVLAVRPHPLHGAIVRFRYLKDGRERELTVGRFITDPDGGR
jgi:hypothetical protein